ncbi:hypothetical protein BKA62DRAFT_282140 [Auriculariales sp. MPI-PUGE-AT-0066]|nr:hypothetical protein BKA62DRAFT_282140 [Auriculariales sp. MPI-PUGE-AT-0066]
MVSALYKACAVGDVAQVAELLKDATPIDVEVKDHTGVTPLIQAVRHGHVEVVKILLDAGADPHNASAVGRPENYTSDAIILELLSAAVARPSETVQQTAPDVPLAQHNGENGTHAPHPVPVAYPGIPFPGSPDGSFNPYYPPQNYPYGPSYPPYGPDGAPLNGHMPPMQYYAMPPPHMQQTPPHGEVALAEGVPPHENGGVYGNLPPPHVARVIPCRYFPACKYGSACMFLHPQTPYFSGPMPPPAQYPQGQQYDSMSPHSAYPPQGAYYPGGYPPQPNGAGEVPEAPFVHGEAVGSPGMVAPQLPPPGMMPYGMPQPMSPYATQPGLPIGSPGMYPGSVPMMPAPLPATMSPYHTRRASVTAYAVAEVQTDVTSPKAEGFAGHSRENSGHRVGRIARGSISGRAKPACAFYPSGRCRNGDACRFPHVIPAEGTAGPAPRGGKRPSVSSIEGKFANMSVNETNGNNGKVNGHPSHNHGRVNSVAGKPAHAPAQLVKQRVPVAADFPVLGGSRSPPLAQNGHLHQTNGPTAADIVRSAAQKPATAPASAEPSKVVVNSDIPAAPLAVLEATPEVPVTA